MTVDQIPSRRVGTTTRLVAPPTVGLVEHHLAAIAPVLDALRRFEGSVVLVTATPVA